MPDPQYDMVRTVRPFKNFETVYQGVTGTVPIAFPGELDPQARAGKTGYAPNLLAGIPVQMGTRVRILIPQTLLDDGTVVDEYEYQVNWRIRNAQDATDATTEQRLATPYHLKFPQQGRPDNTALRYFLPGLVDTVVYEQTEPSPGTAARMNMYAQRYRQFTRSVWLPKLPDGSGGDAVWQQGVYIDGNVAPEAMGPSYAIIEVDAMGDELSIWAFKAGVEGPWDFSGPDIAFSNTYGTNNGALDNEEIGIVVLSGISSP